jgi:hypothetical protein
VCVVCFRTDTQADEKQKLEAETRHYVSGGSESLQVDIDRNTTGGSMLMHCGHTRPAEAVARKYALSVYSISLT